MTTLAGLATPGEGLAICFMAIAIADRVGWGWSTYHERGRI